MASLLPDAFLAGHSRQSKRLFRKQPSLGFDRADAGSSWTVLPSCVHLQPLQAGAVGSNRANLLLPDSEVGSGYGLHA